MFKITLQDGKIFDCESNESIIAGAIRNGVFLDHSCLTGRCSSCKFRIISGQTVCDTEEIPLTESEKSEGYILSCIRRPISDIAIEAEDLSEYGLIKPKTVPAKINKITPLTEDIILVKLRFPPNQKPFFLEGQYLNVIKGSLKRSYSIANSNNAEDLELIIKNYQGGLMSKYWFEEAKINDLLRLEIPKGTFFLRQHSGKSALVFLATGTGIAPIKSILENPKNQELIKQYQQVIVLWGMKYSKELFWSPSQELVKFAPVLSRESLPKKYVQNCLEELSIDWNHSVVYACGSDDMIQESKRKSIQLGLKPNHFYSDAFVASN
ncbi:FAD-binding oxidoreductase [Algoriphagus sp.]|uniref:FAD-binding oxidoreductase n=1 Tax=Algoriphagus sp. TaxID=1872435 RepID=UPI00391D839C